MVPATPKPEAPLQRTTFMAAKLDPTSPLPLPASLLPEPSKCSDVRASLKDGHVKARLLHE